MPRVFVRRLIAACFAAFAKHGEHVLSTRVIHQWIFDRYPRICPSTRELAMVLSRMPGIEKVEGNRRRVAVPADSMVSLWRITA